MDWYEDDELRTQWEAVSRVEEKGRAKENRRCTTLWCSLHRVPEPVATQLMSKEKKLEGKGEQRKVVGWFTQEMDEKVSNLRAEDTEEMVSWRSFEPRRG